MRERVPEWFEQVVGGLSDGKDWVVNRLQNLPLVVRIGGWILFQAILFKVQPWLWDGVVLLFGVMGEIPALPFRTQLLFLLIGLIVVQTVALMLKLISIEDIVESMDASPERSEAIADGGTETKRDEIDEGTTGIGGIGGALAGAAFGSVLGPAGTIGFAVLGAMLGDEYERRELRRRHAIIHGENPKE